MADINNATLIGHLTKDEELKYTNGGMAIGSITLAINRKVKKDGEWVDEPNFFDVVIFGKQAENLQRFLTKGKQIGVTGFLRQERWQDQNGQNRSRVTIIANDLQLLGGKDAPQNNNQGGYDAGFEGEGYGYGN